MFHFHVTLVSNRLHSPKCFEFHIFLGKFSSEMSVKSPTKPNHKNKSRLGHPEPVFPLLFNSINQSDFPPSTTRKRKIRSTKTVAPRPRPLCFFQGKARHLSQKSSKGTRVQSIHLEMRQIYPENHSLHHLKQLFKLAPWGGSD